MVVVARLADAGSHHIRQLDGDHHPVGQAVRIAKRGAFEHGKAVRVLVFRRGSLQHGIAELVERNVLEDEVQSARALLQRRSWNGDDGPPVLEVPVPDGW